MRGDHLLYRGPWELLRSVSLRGFVSSALLRLPLLVSRCHFPSLHLETLFGITDYGNNDNEMSSSLVSLSLSKMELQFFFATDLPESHLFGP